ncbi:MAG: hypothetical protein ACNS61_13070 [Candidatus Wenzhouxiangella sp. M2_3B_020]
MKGNAASGRDDETRRSSGKTRCALFIAFALFAIIVVPGLSAQEEESAPDLPTGLAPPESEEQGGDEPALPEGLGEARDDEKAGEGPTLPEGLGPDAPSERPDDGAQGPGSGSAVREFLDSLTGFWDVRAGVRVRDDPNQRRLSLAETRLQLSRDTYFGPALLRVTADLLYDEIAESHELEPEQGRGWLDLREAYIGSPVGDAVDLRVGRQVLTWGVGDLLFLNDLFPKDWNSFFVGRDVEYLKAPSDAVRASLFLDVFNVDVVYTPKFDPDRFIDNRRLSFFDPRFGRVVGDDVAFEPVRPSGWFEDDEVALRIYRLLAGWEMAAYGYDGFWKSPQGFDPVSGRPVFPGLAAWGGSLRGPVGPGILSAETSWYRSLDDLAGTDPFLPNSQFRFLAGYEQEIVPDFTLGGQYYLERTLDHDALVRNLPAGLSAPDENRHVLTLRATLLTHSQNVTWSLFTFASPSDDDAYLRGRWEWKTTDAWTWSAGFNLFEGRSRKTFFGQFETNSNVYGALRYGF